MFLKKPTYSSKLNSTYPFSFNFQILEIRSPKSCSYKKKEKRILVTFSKKPIYPPKSRIYLYFHFQEIRNPRVILTKKRRKRTLIMFFLKKNFYLRTYHLKSYDHGFCSRKERRKGKKGKEEEGEKEKEKG